MYKKNIGTPDSLNKDTWQHFDSRLSLDLWQKLLPYLKKKLKINNQAHYLIYNLGSNNKSVSEKIKKELPDSKIIDLDNTLFPKDQRYKNFIQADIHNLPLKKNSADLIICSFVFFYLQNKDKAVQEIYHALKPGGQAVFILHTPFSEITKDFDPKNLKKFKELARQMYSYLKYLKTTSSEIDNAIKAVCKKEFNEKINTIEEYEKLCEKNRHKLEVYQYFVENAQKKLFAERNDIYEYFQQQNFVVSEVNALDTSKNKLKTHKKITNRVKHEAWMVIVKK